MTRTPQPTRIRTRTRVVALLAGLAVVLLGVAVLVARGGSHGAAPLAVRFLPAGPGPRGPADGIDWWSPVRGEPLGVAVDGPDVAVAALDEVRLLDVANGRTRWKAGLPGVRRYRPALGADRVVATSETELALFDRADGARVATVGFAGPGPAGVLADAGGSPVVVAGSETGAVLAVDATTGAALWSATYPGSVTVAPRGADGTVVLSWHDDTGATVRAFDLRTGVRRWEVPAGVMAGPPTLGPGTVVFTAGDAVHGAQVRALDLLTGQVRWITPLDGWWDDELEPAADPTTAYLLDGMGTVVALDLRTGTIDWRQETGRPLVSGRVALTPAGVVFASYDDELLLLDRATGRVRAVEPQRGVPVDVATAGDRLVVALRLGAPSRVEARPEPGFDA